MTLHDQPQLDAALRLGLAALVAVPLGWERDRHGRSGGLRTHPLLSVCVCGFLLLSKTAGWEPGEQADAFYGVLTGIGFVMSAAIVQSEAGAAGMSTAVSLWMTGAVGAAVAYEHALVAAALSLFTALTLSGPSLARWKRRASS